jgi:N-acetylglucosaminyldiphosphoundecaprenol N-acetyl-beta-D-mannosaminyltransferase
MNPNVHQIAHIFDVPVHSWPKHDVLEEMAGNIRGARKPMHICITSSELMYHARRVAFIPTYAQNSQLSLCDSAGVAINGYLRGASIRRFTGPMLMEEAFEFGAGRGWRHFFCGGAPGVADALSRRASAGLPGFITAGTYCPPFGEASAEEEQRMVEAINESRADILWVGLGVVRQERWIEKFIARVNVPWLIGVGGAFDYFAGNVPRAPRAIRAVGMEWFYRLVNEPWRYKRISTNLLFGIEGMLDALFGRAPFLGGGPSSDVKPPEWKGRGA